MEIFLPENIRKITEGLAYRIEDIGMSDSCVMIFDEMVLKAEKASVFTKRQNTMLEWLKGKLPVPEIICDETHGEMQYTLMTRIKGEMACAEENMLKPRETVSAIAEGLLMLQSIDIADCPMKTTFASMLDDAEAHLAKTDLSSWSGHFETAEQQLLWLKNNQPEDDFVFAHGDFCMPNIMLKNGRVSGFIDMAQCGAADRWYDIALMQQSLERNFSGFFGGRAYDGFKREMLYDALGFKPDKDRLNFHLLLDELYSV